jgi:hypothetical protein
MRRTLGLLILISTPITRFLLTVVVVSVVVCNSVTSSKGYQSQTKTRQSEDDIALTLKNAEKNQTSVDATIELKTPLSASVLEKVDLTGKIKAVFVTSTTTDRKGVIFSTVRSPITSLAQAVRDYAQYFGSGNLGTRSDYFAITGFTVRGLPIEVVRARDSLYKAEFVSVKAASQPQETRSFSANQGPKALTYNRATSPSAVITPFAPTKAELNVETLSNSERKIAVTFSWNSPSDLAGFADDRSSMEIQVLFLNHADHPVLNNISYVGRIYETARAIETNFNGYLDDPFLDNLTNPEVLQFAIGSERARFAFQAGPTYTMSAIVEGGELAANFMSFSFERGIYKPTESENKAVHDYCQLKGGSDPASCVYGVETFQVTQKNYTGSEFSSLAPTVPSVTHPLTCLIAPGYPLLDGGLSMPEQEAYNLGFRIRRFQRAFSLNGGTPVVGCPSNFVHTDTAWWSQLGRTQDFDGGGGGKGAILLAPDSSVAYWIHGGIWTHYAALGGPNGVLGEPTGEEEPVTSSRGTKGAYQSFKHGWLYYHQPKNKTFYVANAIADKYRSVNLHTDSLGFPISDEYPWEGGARNDFEGGYIHWTPAAGAVIVRFPHYEGYVDVFNCDVIAGWAADRNRLNTPIDVKLYDGGVLIATVPANQSRSDVGAYLKDNGVHGFNIPMPASIKNSQSHSLSIRFEASATNLVGSPRAITCNSVNPSPTPTPSPTNLAPNINSVNPNPVPTFNANQNVQVFGSNLQPSLIVDVFNSSGTKVGTLSGSQIQNLTANSFTMVIFLGSNAGTFGIEVVNPDGKRSPRFTFSTTAATPVVNSLSPSSPPAVNSNQQVSVNGSSFQFNLTVDVFNGAGSKIGTLSGSQILTVSPNSFTMVINLGSTAGNFGIEVVNPSGARSSRFNFSTQPVNPSVNSLNPNPIPTFNANQDVQVSGSNFQSGLTVDVFNSSGTKVGTLSGSQIKNVTTTSFTMVIFLGSSAGTFGMEVVNPNGARSSRFSFSTITPNPNVSSLNPNPVPVFNGNQDVQVSGSNFQFGLTVDVLNSSGIKVGTLSGSQVLDVTPSSFTMVVNLGSTPGSFGIEVVNPSGRRSGRFNFSTR